MSSVLIRQSVSRGVSRSFHDIELDVSEVTIGADANNTIPLRGESVRGKHAVVVAADGVVQVRAVGRKKIVVNGLSVNRVEMSPGDRLTIGQNVILVLPSPPGFELALQVETADPGQDQDRGPDETGQRGRLTHGASDRPHKGLHPAGADDVQPNRRVSGLQR